MQAGIAQFRSQQLSLSIDYLIAPLCMTKEKRSIYNLFHFIFLIVTLIEKYYRHAAQVYDHCSTVIDG